MRQLSPLFLIVAFAMGCVDDPLAGPCNTEDKEDVVYETMKPKDGDNFISQDPTAFLNCESAICLSTNGTKPYCTKRCTKDDECLNGNDVAMRCRVVTEFGPLACRSPKHEYCVGEDIPEEEVCCQRDEETRAVKDPAKYCAAEDGEVPHDPKAEPIGGSTDE